ncbi:MAG: hypothetical protein V2G42_06605 [bacterium JZ-2024 1]
MQTGNGKVWNFSLAFALILLAILLLYGCIEHSNDAVQCPKEAIEFCGVGNVRRVEYSTSFLSPSCHIECKRPVSSEDTTQ